MLIQFLVENFLSFKNETVFSMLAPPEETRGVVEIPAHGLRLMRIASFYGANASGKSNLITAMETARRIIANEQSTDAKLPAHFFRLDAATQTKPSRVQLDFIKENIRYTYVLEFTRDTIVAEALYRKLPNIAEEEMVFEREAPNGDGEHRVKLGHAFDATNEEERQFARFTARGAHVRQPLLLKFSTGNVPGFAAIRRWFATDLKLIRPTTRYRGLITELYESEAMRRFYSEKLAQVGTGILGVSIEQVTDAELVTSLQSNFHDGNESISGVLVNSMLLKFNSAEFNPGVTDAGTEPSLLELKLEHTNRAGFKALFELRDESDGTQRLLHLLPVLYHRTKDSGLCTIIDELDRSLHTTLTRHFVKEFLSMGSGTQTQLIFTTHDTNLLNGQLLPIPAIWFVEKDDDGASHIYSLAEYKPDQIEQLLEHLEEGYLQGRFGAIPFIADRNNLRWQVREEKPAQ